MKLRTHTCRATGCQRVISAGMLMCQEHWDMVPAPLRREVMAARTEWWHEGRFRDVAARAVAAVQEKQKKKAAAIAGASGSLFT